MFVSDFMPHGHCYLWSPEILWINVVADAIITVSYYAIPSVLVYFVAKRRDVPFHWMFIMFGAFIVACGTTHLVSIWTVWHGTYRLEGSIKLVTAILSAATAIALVPLIPKALNLPSQVALTKTLLIKTAELEKKNSELEKFNTFSVGRENRVIELKKEINDLCDTYDIAKRYDVDDL